MRTVEDGVTLIFSHLVDLRRVSSQRLSINWNHVGAFLLYDRIVCRETGLTEVEHVQAGERLKHRGTIVSREFYWSPRRFCDLRIKPDVEEARRALRHAAALSVTAWARRYRRVLLELSGGLDSSIVLGLLRSVLDPEQIVCLNLYSETAEGDERRYARSAAQFARCELIEHPFRSSDVTSEHMLRPVLVASPVQVVFGSVTEDARDRLAEARGSEAIFSGQGGDHLFHQSADSLSVAEYFARCGWGPRLLRVARDVGRMTAEPTWQVVLLAARHRSLARDFNPFRDWPPPAFMHPSCDVPFWTSQLLHPWLHQAEDVPAAKLQHIFSIIDCQIFYTRFCRVADCIHPLISQPLIECCLNLPTFILATGGIRRGLARNAFRDVVPPEITDRASKGASTGYVCNMLLDNVRFIRRILLDGELARQKLLERRSLEEALTERRLIKGNDLGALLAALRAEIWVQQVASEAARAVA